jgi:hypothetical protein
MGQTEASGQVCIYYLYMQLNPSNILTYPGDDVSSGFLDNVMVIIDIWRVVSRLQIIIIVFRCIFLIFFEGV